MRFSQYLLNTYKETPNDAEVISHRYMLRAGMIRKLGSGLYSWLPLGLRVLKKIETIVRQEMNSSGAHELLLPNVNPAELWQETNRWQEFGPQLLKITDRHGREFCFGPTHEEVITDLIRNSVKSYKQLPLNLYQIQTKFRDEIRPRFGVMRAREFLMKDAYSFHLNRECLQQTYQVMHDTYSRIFDRIGLTYRAVLADTGSIGGFASQEFQVLAESGEDQIFYSDGSDYAANIEYATSLAPNTTRAKPSQAMQQVDTPTQRTIEEVAQHLAIPIEKIIKTLIVKGTEHELVALVLRGDHELNHIKAEKLPQIAAPLEWASEADIARVLDCQTGFLGPVNLSIPYIVDRDAAQLADFTCGANQQGQHYTNVNWERDAKLTNIADIRNVKVGDLSPDGKGTLQSCRGIEVGHIFQLGDKYSQAMNAKVLDETGQAVAPMMGCYGIGISRIAAACIEQHNDENGIIWPIAIAPFQVNLLAMNMHKSAKVREAAENIYQQLTERGIEVLFDDRNERAGVMFADSDLLGIPYRIVIGERSLEQGQVEYKARDEDAKHTVSTEQIVELLTSIINL